MGGERTLLHRTLCTEPDSHVAPIGFDLTGPREDGEHGESLHPSAVAEQCMCGHPTYYSCPDWLGVWTASVACTADYHHLCDFAGWNDFVGEFQPDTCPCDCHVTGKVVAA